MKKFNIKSKFNNKGAKYKRFMWKKNKNNNRPKFGVRATDDGDENVNYNIIPESPTKSGK